jgi:polyferredoxin
MIRLLTIVFFLEVGLVLAVVPWSTYWERNYFADIVPFLHVVITNYFFRGAVSGLGLINLAAAIAEVRSLLGGRRLQGSMLPLRDSSAVEE